MTRAEGGTRNDAGPGGDGEDLVVRLSADPQALREYIARRDAEMRELRRFVTLAAGCAEAVLQGSERLRNTV